jgi:hypothetical protein
MPKTKKKHLRGVGEKEQRQYEHIKEKSKKRYGKRAKEVAARTVLKQHKRKGHKKGERLSFNTLPTVISATIELLLPFLAELSLTN